MDERIWLGLNFFFFGVVRFLWFGVGERVWRGLFCFFGVVSLFKLFGIFFKGLFYFGCLGVLIVLVGDFVILVLLFEFFLIGVEGIVVVIGFFVCLDLVLKFFFVGVEGIVVKLLFKMFILLFLWFKFKFLYVIIGDKYCLVVGLVIRFGKNGFKFSIFLIWLLWNVSGIFLGDLL